MIRSCRVNLKPNCSNALGSPVSSPVATALTCAVSTFIHDPAPPVDGAVFDDAKGFQDMARQGRAGDGRAGQACWRWGDG